ncbi:MAG: DnaB-like helicase C-terminal domain-containing protein, partial [Candidatus Buchananbacteria bacterium]
LTDHGENDDFSRINHAMGLLSEAKIYIDDSASAGVMEIRTKARRLQSEHGLDLIVIDYLQLMEGRSNKENRVQEVSDISRNLKAIARELNVPVLALSQLSRGVESRDSHVPRLADLRESGSIEQDADVVLFIYREKMYHQDLPPDKANISEIHIAKHRNGPTGKVRLFFDEHNVTFKNLDRKIPDDEINF